MGIEQSSMQPHPSSASRSNPRVKVRTDSSQTTEENGRSSPHPSCSSDVDVPYVSYTVNRPIGGIPDLKCIRH